MSPEASRGIADLFAVFAGTLVAVIGLSEPASLFCAWRAGTRASRFAAVGSNAVAVVSAGCALAVTANAGFAVFASHAAAAAMVAADMGIDASGTAFGQFAALDFANAVFAFFAIAAGIEASTAVFVVVHDIGADAVAHEVGGITGIGIGFFGDIGANAVGTSLGVAANDAAAAAVLGIRGDIHAGIPAVCHGFAAFHRGFGVCTTAFDTDLVVGTWNAAVAAGFGIADDIDTDAVADHFGFFGTDEFAGAIDAAQAFITDVAASTAVGSIILKIGASAPTCRLGSIFAGHSRIGTRAIGTNLSGRTGRIAVATMLNIRFEIVACVAASGFICRGALLDAVSGFAGIAFVTNIAAGTAVGTVGQGMHTCIPANDVAFGDFAGFGIGFTLCIAVIDANAVFTFFIGFAGDAAVAAVFGIVDDIGANTVAAAHGIGRTAAAAAASFFFVAAQARAADFFGIFAEIFAQSCRFTPV